MSDPSDKLALFDFDGTLYKYDSILSFCFFYYRKKPLRIWRVIMQVYALVLWKSKRINTSTFKSKFICFIARDSDQELRRMATQFWNNKDAFNEELMFALQRCQAERLCVVVVSASPDLFILPACEKLGIKHVVSTTLRIHEDGYTLGTNCRGSEKTIRLRAVFPTQRIVRAYSDNTDDLQLLRTAEQGFLVKNGAIRSVPNVGDFH
jgi:HAD superfamily hydrolase (TIGR01490 family)